jgi:cytochrome P450
MTETEILFNPFEPGFTDDPYPAYRRLRAAEPVHRTLVGAYLLTTYADVAAVLRSELSIDPSNVADGWFREQRARLESTGVNRGLSMLDRDPPDHTRLRSLVTKVFTPRSVAALEPLITELVDEGLDRLADAGAADLVETLAFPVPFAVISRMLGIPATDHARIRELSGWLVRTLEIIPDEQTMQSILRAQEEMVGVTAGLVEWKRANPGDDLLSALIAAEQDGDKLTDEVVIAQVILLYVAGHETTVNLIANGTTAMLRHPDQLALLRERPDLAANAVEEFLRYDSPVQQTRRVTQIGRASCRERVSLHV